MITIGDPAAIIVDRAFGVQLAEEDRATTHRRVARVRSDEFTVHSRTRSSAPDAASLRQDVAPPSGRGWRMHLSGLTPS